MTVIRGGIAVEPWVQAFADEADRSTPVHDFGTYNGHQPTAALALDCFADLVAHPERGDALVAWAMPNYKRLGIDYIIWQRRIWNPEISPNWRPYHGPSPHVDHVHISFIDEAPTPQPTPDPQPEEERMLYIVTGSGSNYVTDLVSSKITLASEGEIAALIAAGAKDARATVPASIVDRIPLGDA